LTNKTGSVPDNPKRVASPMTLGNVVRELDVKPAVAPTWDMRDAAGRKVSAAFYFARLGGPDAPVRKVVLVD